MENSWRSCWLKAAGISTVSPAPKIDSEGAGGQIAEVPELPGVLSYGATRDDAIRGLQVLALRVLADRIEHGEKVPDVGRVFSVAAPMGHRHNAEQAGNGSYPLLNRSSYCKR